LKRRYLYDSCSTIVNIINGVPHANQNSIEEWLIEA
jgi:hypothetical protein